jgi:hypothetical protein
VLLVDEEQAFDDGEQLATEPLLSPSYFVIARSSSRQAVGW